MYCIEKQNKKYIIINIIDNIPIENKYKNIRRLNNSIEIILFVVRISMYVIYNIVLIWIKKKYVLKLNIFYQSTVKGKI